METDAHWKYFPFGCNIMTYKTLLAWSCTIKQENSSDKKNNTLNVMACFQQDEFSSGLKLLDASSEIEKILKNDTQYRCRMEINTV